MQALAALGISATGIESIALAAEAVIGGVSTGETASVTGTGGELLVAQIKAAGIHYVFSNPGSFEAAFFDALVDKPGINLILGLHEGVVIAMADGYQKASGKPAFINLHAIGGTAQALGQLYNSSRDHSALVVTAGLLDNEVFNDDLTLAPRPGFSQKDLARQFSRSVSEVRDPRAVALFFRRALKVAMTEPGGPTFLGIPNTVLRSKATAHIFDQERFLSPEDVPPRTDHVASVVKLLLQARAPALILGDEVARAGAQSEALELAELLGVPVFESPLPAFHCFPRHHALFKGRFDGPGERCRDQRWRL